MTGFRQAFKDAYARGAVPAADVAPSVTYKVRDWAAVAPGRPISMRLLIANIEALKPIPHPAPTPATSSPHIQLSFNSATVTVTGSGFRPNLPGVLSNAVHLRVVDVDNPTIFEITDHPSDSAGSFSADVSFSDAVFAGLTAAFSAYDNRLDPTSVPANGPLTSNTVSVTNISSPNRRVSST